MPNKDYAFAPGMDEYDQALRRLFKHRAGTILIDRKNVRALQQFIKVLDDDQSIQRPVGNLFIGGHGTNLGTVNVEMWPAAPEVVPGDTTTDFEALQQTITDLGKSIKLPPTIFRDDLAPVRFLHIKGCNLGNAQKFLNKFKQALDFPGLNVTAPKFFHSIAPPAEEKIIRYGVWEYFHYEFVVHSNVRYEAGQRQMLVDGFKAKNFRFYNDEVVPLEMWDRWIPQDISVENKPAKYRLRFGLPGGQARSVGKLKTIGVERKFEVGTATYDISLDFGSSANVPMIEVGQKVAFETRVATIPQMQASGGNFTHYEQFGYQTLQQFLAAFKWRYVARERYLDVHGDRYDYLVQLPVVVPGTNVLIANFHPIPVFANFAFRGLDEAVETFFGKSQ